MVLFSNTNIRLNLYTKCIKPLFCCNCEKAMSTEDSRALFQKYFFHLKRSRSFDSIFKMRPSNRRVLLPNPPNFNPPIHPGHNLITQTSNNDYRRYWQEYYRYYDGRHVPMDQKRHYFKRSNSTGDMPSSNARGVQATTALLKTRVWEVVAESKTRRGGFVFSVMSYNVLAQHLLNMHPELYRRHDSNALQWEVRWKNLYREIQFLSPDILCLQEVQESHLEIYMGGLYDLGYRGVYKKRTRMTVDGCAIFYKTELLNLEGHETVEYFQPDSTLLNRDNVAIVAKFSPKMYPENKFVVATTHLLYNPKRQDVRMAQAQVLLAEIERTSFQNYAKPYLPAIITGDFNATPNTLVYNTVIEGILKHGHSTSRSPRKSGTNLTQQALTSNVIDLTESEVTDSIELADDDDAIEKSMKNVKIEQQVALSATDKPAPTQSQRLAFKSVYTHGPPGNCEATTYQNKWITVDYIFYSVHNAKKDQSLQLLSRYKLPLRKECSNDFKIPNCLLGSDHLCLMSQFRLKIDQVT